MPENEWNVYSNNMRISEVSGYFYAAARAANELDSLPHDDRQINPIPKPQPQQMTCRPTRTIKQRDFHGRIRRLLAELKHEPKPKHWPPLHSHQPGKAKVEQTR